MIDLNRDSGPLFPPSAGAAAPPPWVHRRAPPWQMHDEPLVQEEPCAIEPDADDAPLDDAAQTDAAHEDAGDQPEQPESEPARKRTYRKVTHEALSGYAAEIARHALGPENIERSTKEELCFGTNGSRKVVISGPNAGAYHDHENKRGGGIMQLLAFELGLTGRSAYDWLRAELGLDVDDGHHNPAHKNAFTERIVATYDYRDESGAMLYQVVRLKDPKDFRQRAPTTGGGWSWKVKGIRQVPFMLPELLAAPADARIYVPEGEKDVLNAQQRGLIATCNAGGAGKWRAEFSQYFAGCDVVIPADNDDAGRAHAYQVAKSLAPVARSVRVLSLPGLPPKGDLSDWFEAGGTREELETLAAEAPLFEPTPPTDPEILPGFNAVLRQAQELAQDAPPDVIKGVLTQIAAGRFSRTEQDRLVFQIQAQTGIGLRSLRGDLKEARRQLPQAPQQRGGVDWRALLICDDESKEPKPIMANVVIVMRNHPAWENVLALDDFTSYVTLRAAPPWLDDEQREQFEQRPITDADIRAATLWLQSETGIHAASHVVFEGMQAAAEQAHFHPPRDYLNDLVWDRKPRIDNLFPDYFGVKVESTDQRRLEYYKAIGARSMIAAVARIFEPGCKNDTTPNLYGEQGTGKSSAIEALFEPWYTDDLAEMGSKDSQMQVAGVWGVEVGEMVAARRDTDRTKAFISRRTDRFRPPYGKLVVTQKRQCVFWGTTNRDVFLFDETGNRRSWAVTCGVIDTGRLKGDRDQLWAEAVVRYRGGERYWLHEAELIETAAEVQAEFMEEDAWHQTVVEFVAKRTETTIADVLGHIGVLIQDRNQGHANRVAKILRALGWTRRQSRDAEGRRSWRYFCHRPQNTGDGTGAGQVVDVGSFSPFTGRR